MMGNPFEAIFNHFKVKLDVEDKAPLHVIEVGDCWTYVGILEEFIRYEEIGLNTSTDDEIIEMLNDAIKLCESQVKRLSTFLRNEGIPLPDVTSAKPKSNPNEVPLGVKLTDDEISNGVAFKMVNLMQLCGKGQADAIRADVAMMWLEFFSEIVTFGSTLKTLMRKRGWLKVPPYYYPPGIPIR
ncbi:DUF3231 family protein [Cytobacillus sp. FJAT-54145]|uniref:DUF3231 family protein n=1 Tax=Cytobacillus spartinae TaxID=3299023 RepID=A0ABW6K7J8_9BACI